MHRHGYKGRKLHRKRDQRRALIKGLADSLIVYETIETTLPKAKEVTPYVEKLITKAKKKDLHSRRKVIASLNQVSSAHKLIDDIAPKLNKRQSGYLSIKKTITRRGDNAQLAKISFVDDLSVKTQPKVEKTDELKPKSTATKVKQAKSSAKEAKK
ncbi:MAG TPA: 50S ribosomal protein L17 [Patescibacteria group bacterium]|nr:50S ribosomal protein L17 [Patescibacteria group bacterium]